MADHCRARDAQRPSEILLAETRTKFPLVILYMHLSRKNYWALGTAALGIYLLFSLIYLELPGLECDETIFVNPALGNLDGTSMAWHLPVGRFDIPIMIMRYIGAVKSYLYAPIFALFGTSVTTVRLPVVLLGLVTLGFTYATVRAMLGREIALLSFVLLATDPSFIFANRLDWGPISLMMVFKTTALYVLWRWLHDGKLSQLALASFLLGVGLFDKIVFVWFIGAVALALPLCFWPRIKPRLTKGAIVLALLSFLAGCGPLVAYNIRFPLLTFKDQKVVTTSWSEGLAYRYRLFHNTLAGSEILLMVNEQAPGELAATYRQPAADALDSVFTGVLRLFPLQRSLTAISFVVSLVIIVALAVRSQLHNRGRVFFFVLLFLFITVCICLTAQATGPHHVIMVYPFGHILIACAGWEILTLAASIAPGTWRKLARASVGCGIGLVILAPIVVDVGYIKAFKVQGGSGRWSDAIYRLDDYIRENPNKHFLLMDWGFSPQLLVLRRGKIHWEEAFVPVLESTAESEKIESLHPYLINPDDLFVFHVRNFETYPVLETFQKALAHYGLDFSLVDELYQRDGRQIYLLYRATHPELEVNRKLGNYFYFREGEEYDDCSTEGIDFKPTASRRHTLGNYWGKSASDYAVYRWRTTGEISDATLGIRYSSEVTGRVRIDVLLDGRRTGTLEMDPTGGFGFKASDWRTAKLQLGNVGPGEHQLRFQALEADRPVNFDYFYLVEGDFEFTPPVPAPASARVPSETARNLDAAGFRDRPDVRLEVNAPVLIAGKSTLYLRVVNLDASSIDVLYTLDGRYMPAINDWMLDRDHTISVFLDNNTSKGRYVFKAIRDSRNPSPSGWIRVDVPVVVK